MYVGEVDSFAPRLRERWPMAALMVLFVLVGAAIIFMRKGPATVETGEIVRFGIRANHLGNQPTVIVRTAAGEQREFIAPAGSLRGCISGDDIQLLRKPNGLEAAPVACP
jgi:hypothetical protein